MNQEDNYRDFMSSLQDKIDDLSNKEFHKLPTEFVFDDGYKRYPLKNMLDITFGILAFNPSDTGIFKRYDDLVEKINGLSIDENAGMEEQVRFCDDALIQAFTIMLNDENVEKDLFFKYAPMTLFPDGRFYAECLVETIGNIIEAETGSRLDKKIAKIKRDTAKNRS